MWNDFVKGYAEWIFHRESILSFLYNQPLHIEHTPDIKTSNLQRNPIRENDMRDLFRDTLEFGIENLEDFNKGQEITMILERFIFTDPMYVERPQHSSSDKIK